MRIRIDNLGPVKHADIDLKPLTVFVGPNNAGKSWTAELISAMLGTEGWERYQRYFLSGECDDQYPLIETAAQELARDGRCALDFVEVTRSYAASYFSALTGFANKWIGDALVTDRVRFDELHVGAELDTPMLSRILERALTISYGTPGQGGPGRFGGWVNPFKAGGDPILYFEAEHSGASLPPVALRERLYSLVFLLLQKLVYRDQYFLPVERSWLLAVSGGPEPTGAAEDGSRESAAGKLPYALVQYVRAAGMTPYQRRKWEPGTTPGVARLDELAGVLERRVLGGQLRPVKSVGRPQVVFTPRGVPPLEVRVASSMVRELMPLCMILKVLAEPGDLLTVDEPEMNLHPEAQVRLMEVLAATVNAGVHVLFTTHSTYMVDHLANLMKGYAVRDDADVQKLLRVGLPESFVAPDDVSVYLFDRGTAKSIKEESGSIDWGTFGAVSDRLAHTDSEIRRITALRSKEGTP
jgi:hypothetical protein